MQRTVDVVVEKEKRKNATEGEGGEYEQGAEKRS